MKDFQIGSGLTCNLDQLVDTRLLVQANSGGGKSWLLRRLLEQTHGHVQHLVIDPEGEFASLRERFDYVLAARGGGDTAADPRSAALLAERLLELKVSAILDIYELKPHERVRFVRLFLEALVNAPKALWHPVLVIVDEAHVYCPESGSAESADAVKDLATRGRKRGFSAVLATQRLSKLHKDAAAECNNKLIGRTTLDVDVKRAAHELGVTEREALLILRSLDPGEFFAYGPALHGHATEHGVVRTRTGAIETTHPKAGARLAFTPPPPTSKITALLPKLSDLPKEATERQRSLDDLQQELSTARREITRLLKAAPVAAAPAEPKVIEKFVLKDGQLARAEKLADRLSALVPLVEELRQIGNDIATAVVTTTLPPPHASVPAPRREPLTPTNSVGRARPVSPPGRPARDGVEDPLLGKLTNPEQRIVDAIAWLESLGVEQPEQPAVAFLANYRYGCGGFNNPRGALRQAGLVAYLPGDRIVLTAAGRSVARYPEEALTNAELQRRVLARLPNPEQRVLVPLLESYPKPMGNEDLAAAANYEPGSGGFNNPKGRLRTLGLIEYSQPGYAVAKSLLFPEGRR